MESTSPERIEINPAFPIQIACSWEFVNNQAIDLDVQCVILNQIGEIEDAVFYNQPSSKCHAITLNNDSKDGALKDLDEVITINLNQLSLNCKCLAFIICSYNGNTFKEVETASATVLQNGKQIHSVPLGALGDFNSCLSSLLYREFDGRWYMVNTQKTGAGKQFMECEKLIKENLGLVGFDIGLLMESKEWSASSGKKFDMKKNQILMVPDGINKIVLALGWDTYCDIDASVLMLQANGIKTDAVSFSKKESNDLAVRHMGDNLTGIGDGDDETVTIQLDKIHPDTTYLFPVINIYSMGKQFDQVKGAYARVVDPLSKKEFCRFNLSKNHDGISSGCIIAQISRNTGNKWSIQALGYYTKNTRRAAEMEQFADQVLRHNLKNVIILADCQKEDIVNIQAAKQPSLTTFIYKVKIIKGQDFGVFDVGGKSDPYVKVKHQGRKLYKSKCIKENLNPVWEEEFYAYLDNKLEILFEVYDYDFMMSDDYMGQCTLNGIPDADLGKELKLELTDKNKQKNPKFPGFLYVRLEKGK